MANTASNMWDSRYNKTIYAYGKAPNLYFAQELAKIPAAGLLLPGDGEGRNAVHALKEGWNVIAFDQSEKARDKAMALAEENGVELDFTVVDARAFQCPVLVDVLAYTYFHLPATIVLSTYKRLNEFLTPGGQVIFEAFSPKYIGMGSGGPQTESMCFTVKEVKEIFSDFREIEVWEEKILLNEGLYHDGDAWVVRARGIK